MKKDYNTFDGFIVGNCFVWLGFLRSKNPSSKCNHAHWLPPKLTVSEILPYMLCCIRTPVHEIYFDLDSGSSIFLKVKAHFGFFALMHHRAHAHALSKYIHITGL